jgi:triosephosphate isomerase
MYKLASVAKVFINDFAKLAEGEVFANAVICPPTTLLSLLSDAGLSTKLGGQNCCALSSKEGAFTGEVSAEMLKDLGCEYVIIGHSERRRYQLESEDELKKKIVNAHQEGLKAIICIGETLLQRESGEYKQILEDMLINILPESVNSDNIIIAYEPVWAIGTGKNASFEQIEEVHNFLSEKLLSRFAFDAKIIYGGSVNLENAQAILNIKKVSGLLIGGASLDADKFYKIIKISER